MLYELAIVPVTSKSVYSIQAGSWYDQQWLLQQITVANNNGYCIILFIATQLASYIVYALCVTSPSWAQSYPNLLGGLMSVAISLYSGYDPILSGSALFIDSLGSISHN